MTTPTRQSIHARTPQRLVLFVLAMMVAGYFVVFMADGAAPGFGILRDAIANTLAAAVSALPVWWLNECLGGWQLDGGFCRHTSVARSVSRCSGM